MKAWESVQAIIFWNTNNLIWQQTKREKERPNTTKKTMSKHITHIPRCPCCDERLCPVFVRSYHFDMHWERLVYKALLEAGPNQYFWIDIRLGWWMNHTRSFCRLELFRYLSRLCQGSKGPCVWYQVAQNTQKKPLVIFLNKINFC